MKRVAWELKWLGIESHSEPMLTNYNLRQLILQTKALIPVLPLNSSVTLAKSLSATLVSSSKKMRSLRTSSSLVV